MNTGVVKLHALANSVRATAQDDDLLALRWNNLCLLVVAAVVVGSQGRELTSAGIHRFEHGTQVERVAELSDFLL